MEDQDISDRELSDIVKKRQQDIENYRRNRGQPTPSKDSLVGLAKSGKQKKKSYSKNKWEGPDKDYTKIPNQFIKATYRQYLRPNETKVLLYLVTKTWGWKKRSEFIPLKQFEKELDILKPHISRALSSLAHRRIVTKLGNKRYAIQSDSSLWQDRPRKTKDKKQKLPKK
ncbi:MAG: hypothetical protein GH144_01205 [Clostridia bacterium]|nr:hypothetical protein [Clostridia bacterium]